MFNNNLFKCFRCFTQNSIDGLRNKQGPAARSVGKMKDTAQGCPIKLVVEFPSAMPNACIRAHLCHLAYEFYNWFSEFERRLSNG